MISFKSVQSKKGFTMVELLIAVAIIAVLSAVGLASFTAAQKKGRDARRIEDMNKIHDAAEQYFIANNIPPATNAQLQTFINPIPADPRNAGTYIYTINYDANIPPTTFSACALLEQGTGGNSSSGTTFTPSAGGTGYCVKNLQ